MNRRAFLHAAANCAAASAAYGWLPAHASAAPPLTPPTQIEPIVHAARPLLGGSIPADLAQRLGATHYAGKYHLTDEPFIIEGSKALLNLGMKVAKYWFAPSLPGYGYNSDWKLRPDMRLIEVAQHPYFRQCFAMPFSAFALEIQPVAKGRLYSKSIDFSPDEEQLAELTEYLLRTYRDREVTFILQHWEGDWMMRGTGVLWDAKGPSDLDARSAGMARWLEARQRGVTKGRAKVPGSKCRVHHAVEVNRVIDILAGIPTLTSHVLPRISVDMISWSAYDGASNITTFWQGLELIQHHARPAPDGKPPQVFIGEIGYPEHGRPEAEIIAFWDKAMGVMLARKLPWIIHWELYCNEPLESAKGKPGTRRIDELRGFWLIRPDGVLSPAAEYFKALLDHAGGTLPASIRDRWKQA